MKTNANLQNKDEINGISLMNIHTLPKFKEYRKWNDMYRVVKNGDVSGGHCFMNYYTLSEANNHNSIGYTKQSGENVINIYEIYDTGLQYGVDIDVIIHASKLFSICQYGIQ